MKKILFATAILALGATAVTHGARLNFNFPGAATFSALDANGVALIDSPSGPWTFQLGGFLTADPATLEFDMVVANWTTALQAGLVTSGPAAQIGRLNSTQPYNEASLVGAQPYIIGYNSLDVAASSQWVLVTNPNWAPFPALDPTGLTTAATYNVAAAGTVALIGSVSETGLQMQVIPEPSTYALMFGLGILGFLGYRRFRK